MPARSSFDYAVVRVVPRVEREEFVNAGVILYCRARDFLAASMALDEARLRALDPAADLEVVRRHLSALVQVAAGDVAGGPLALLPQRERWHWLVAPRSTIIQVSAVHSGLCEEPASTLAHLVEKMVRPPSA
jgi:hypothetical protein